MKDDDRYRQIAQLHVQGIQGGFLSLIGVPFVALMYEALDRVDGAILLTEERDGRVIGFVAGGNGLRPIYMRMLLRPMRLVLALVPSLTSIGRLRKIVEILRYGSAIDPEFPRDELLSIAVAPDFRGTGVAEKLYRRLMEAFRSRGVDAFRITVGTGLAPAQRFYRRMGALPSAEIEVHRRESSTVFIQSLRARPET